MVNTVFICVKVYTRKRTLPSCYFDVSVIDNAGEEKAGCNLEFHCRHLHVVDLYCCHWTKYHLSTKE